MAHSVRFHPEAAEETQAVTDRYRERSAEAAAGFVAELNHAIERVAELPETWPSYKANTRRFIFRIYPFSLVYRIARSRKRFRINHDFVEGIVPSARIQG